VTYTVDICGRKRETTQDRLSRATDSTPGQPKNARAGTLALEPPPRPSGSSRVPYDATTAAPAAISTVALVQRASDDFLRATLDDMTGCSYRRGDEAGRLSAFCCSLRSYKQQQRRNVFCSALSAALRRWSRWS
jgi:hypothetical protein